MSRLGRRDTIQGVHVASFPAIGRRVCRALSGSEREARARYFICTSPEKDRYDTALKFIPHKGWVTYEDLPSFYRSVTKWENRLGRDAHKIAKVVANEWFRLSTEGSAKDAIAERIYLIREDLISQFGFATRQIQEWVDACVQDLQDTTDVRSPLTLLLLPASIHRTLQSTLVHTEDDLDTAVKERLAPAVEKWIKERSYLQLYGYGPPAERYYLDLNVDKYHPKNNWAPRYTSSPQPHAPANYRKSRMTTYRIGDRFSVMDKEAFGNFSILDTYLEILTRRLIWSIGDTVWRQCEAYAEPLPSNEFWQLLEDPRCTIIRGPKEPRLPFSRPVTVDWSDIERDREVHIIALEHGRQGPTCFVLSNPIRISIATDVVKLRDTGSYRLSYQCSVDFKLEIPSVWKLE